MNILFITADQWRAECLSTLDHAVVRTPNIDALAEQGVLFENHYAQATPCSPSRTSLHTGLYLHNHRVCQNGTPLDDRHTNWALEVRRADYVPFLFGYTDTAADPRGMEADDPRLKHFSEPLRGLETDTVYHREVPLNWIAHLEKRAMPYPQTPGASTSWRKKDCSGKMAVRRHCHPSLPAKITKLTISWITASTGSEPGTSRGSVICRY